MLAVWRAVETCRNRFAPLDHTLINQAQRRHLDFVCGAKSIAVLARQVLRIDIGQANARVKATTCTTLHSADDVCHVPVDGRIQRRAAGEGEVLPAYGLSGTPGWNIGDRCTRLLVTLAAVCTLLEDKWLTS